MAEEKVQELSRRKFLKGAGAALAVTALAGGVGGILTGCSEQSQSANAAAPEWPYTYTKLDPDKAEELAYESYVSGSG